MILSASSPDDEALVLGAKYFGFEFVNRIDSNAVLNTWDVTAPPTATKTTPRSSSNSSIASKAADASSSGSSPRRGREENRAISSAVDASSTAATMTVAAVDPEAVLLDSKTSRGNGVPAEPQRAASLVGERKASCVQGRPENVGEDGGGRGGGGKRPGKRRAGARGDPTLLRSRTRSVNVVIFLHMLLECRVCFTAIL